MLFFCYRLPDNGDRGESEFTTLTSFSDKIFGMNSMEMRVNASVLIGLVALPYFCTETVVDEWQD